MPNDNGTILEKFNSFDLNTADGLSWQFDFGQPDSAEDYLANKTQLKFWSTVFGQFDMVTIWSLGLGHFGAQLGKCMLAEL